MIEVTGPDFADYSDLGSDLDGIFDGSATDGLLPLIATQEDFVEDNDREKREFEM